MKRTLGGFIASLAVAALVAYSYWRVSCRFPEYQELDLVYARYKLAVLAKDAKDRGNANYPLDQLKFFQKADPKTVTVVLAPHPPDPRGWEELSDGFSIGKIRFEIEERNPLRLVFRATTNGWLWMPARSYRMEMTANALRDLDSVE